MQFEYEKVQNKQTIQLGPILRPVSHWNHSTFSMIPCNKTQYSTGYSVEKSAIFTSHIIR